MVPKSGQTVDIEHLDALIVVAGVSGAGKSRALDVIGDLGFFNIENLPVRLFDDFLKFTKEERAKLTKFVILPDISQSDKLAEFLAHLDGLTALKGKIQLIFLDCATETIVRRYSETRRPHPSFDPITDKTLEDAIVKERSLLLPFREKANLLLDTTKWSIHDLRREITTFIESLSLIPSGGLRINFLSFGFKHGVPADADLLVDVRFLPNPYFVEHLREKTGLDSEVQDYVLSAKDTKEFLSRYEDLLRYLIPHYMSAGKAYLNVAIGCTGGKHRSVAIAETLAKALSGPDRFLGVKHRDKDL